MPASVSRPAMDLLGSKWKRQLEEEKVPEWRDQYMDVDAIVKGTAAGYGTDPSANDPPDGGGLRSRNNKRQSQWSQVKNALLTEDGLAHNLMMRSFDQEVAKVNKWAKQQFQETSSRLDLVAPYVKEYPHLNVGDKRILRDAVVQIYTLLLLLDNYCSLNCVIFHQAGKFLHPDNNKYVVFLVKNVQDPPFFIKIMTLDIKQKMLQTAKCYAEMEGIGVATAEEELKGKLQAPLPSFSEGLHLGLRLGMAVPLLMADIYLSSLPREGEGQMIYANCPIFRGTAVIILAIWLWGIIVRIMEKAHINYAFILDLDPASRLHWKQILEFAGLWTNLWLWTHCIFNVQVKLGVILIPNWLVSTTFLPSAFFILASAIFLSPFDIAYRPTRWWILRQVAAVLCSPLVPVTFASNFVGDYLTSLVKALIDINYSICFIYSGSWRTSDAAYCMGQGHVAFMLTLLPLNFRLLQCLRRYRDDGRHTHLWNFGKYATSTTAVLVGLFHPHYNKHDSLWTPGRIFYILLLIASTIYSWIWDVFMDWGLYYKRADGKWVARPTMLNVRGLLPALDLIGRCAWAYTIVVDPPGERFGVAMLVFFSAMVEVLRRSMWAGVRIGNEHHSNASQYRVVKEVPLSQLRTTPVTRDTSHSSSQDNPEFNRLTSWLSDRGNYSMVEHPASPFSGPMTPANPKT